MRNFGYTTQDERLSLATAPDRKVVQISTIVHPKKDWAFIALCDDGSLWLYHGSWSQIEGCTADYLSVVQFSARGASCHGSRKKRPVNGHSALWKKMRRPTTIGGKRLP